MPKPKRSPHRGFSYLRFSSPEQGKGDSLRRQTELRDAWLAKTGVTLDTSLTLRDEGVSAFTGTHRENPDRNALAAFLELVKQNRIPRGSYLLVENLDRLSREHIRPAVTLLLNLIEHGIRVVQLLPVEAVYDEDVEPMALMMAIMELSRGHAESRMKSERVGRAWKEKRARAAATGEPLTKSVPGWLKVESGRFVLDQSAARTIRLVYRLAIEGHGATAITKRLNADGVPGIGRGGHWARATVAKLLQTRKVVGEYQPHRGHGTKNRKADGPPLPNYFPVVVTEADWQKARGAITNRHNKGGRPASHVNVFAGLLIDARDGGKFHRTDKGAKSSGPVLVSHRAASGVPGAKYVTFPLPVFEAAILSSLREVDPKDILPGNTSGAVVLALSGRSAELRRRIDAIQEQLVAGDEDVAPLMVSIRRLEAEWRATEEELAAARRAAASPLSEAWTEARTLLDVLAASPEPETARVRLRATLRRMVEGMWCLFVPSGSDRLAAVQIRFEGGGRRDYLIVYTVSRGNQWARAKSQWWTRSFASASLPDGLDLRDRGHAADLERVLAAVGPAALADPGKSS